jgi:hypothetical protein
MIAVGMEVKEIQGISFVFRIIARDRFGWLVILQYTKPCDRRQRSPCCVDGIKTGK